MGKVERGVGCGRWECPPAPLEGQLILWGKLVTGDQEAGTLNKTQVCTADEHLLGKALTFLGVQRDRPASAGLPCHRPGLPLSCGF